RQTSHHGKSLCTCSRRSASLSQGRPPGWLWTSATISPCISACSQSSGDSLKYASGLPEIFTQGKYLSPSGVLTTKPHASAGAHRRACARIADSVSVMGLLRKFVNGKEAAKVADVIAELTSAQAFAAFILRDIGRRLVIFIRDRRTAITALIAAIGPGAGVGQHDTSRKNSAIRLSRRGQYKRGTDRAQFDALPDASAAAHLLLRIGVAVSVDEVHRIQKAGVNLTPDHRSADQTLQIFRHPGDHAVQVRDRQCRTGSTALAVHLKSTPLNGIGLILPTLPGDRLTFFVLLITEKVAIPAYLGQVDFPEHHAGRLLRTNAFIQRFLLYV